MDLILQKLTELGVSKIIPLKTERSIVKLDEKRESKKLIRWQAICKEAKKYNVALEINCGCFINETKRNIHNEERYRYPYDKFWKIAIDYKQYIKNPPVKYLLNFYSLPWYVNNNGDRYYYECEIVKI